jgi:DtxR family Mn-dependent transcriptional regulator
MASVTGMVKHLAAEGLLKHKPYHGVTLTDRGRQAALATLRRHRILELFLVKTLDLGWDEVDSDADALEHAISDQLIERIYDFLGRPDFDPHGSPIPTRDGKIRTVDRTPLADVPEKTPCKIVRVSDNDSEFLRYLTKSGIRIGTQLTVLERAPFDGPVTIRVGRKRVTLGVEACRRIDVVLEDGESAT